MINFALKGRVHRRRTQKWASTTDSLRGKLAGRFALYWMVVAAVLALGSAISSSQLAANAMAEDARDGVRFNLLILALALAFSVGIGVTRPDWWRRALFILSIGPVPVLLLTSHTAAPGGATLLCVFVTSWLGRVLAGRFLGKLHLLDGWIIGGTLGFAFIATYGLLAGMLGLLQLPVTWGVLLGTALGLVLTSRAQLGRDCSALTSWLSRPVKREPSRFVLAGAALACFWLNLVGTLAPEIRSDAIRQRLASAVQFAQYGNLGSTSPDLYVAKAPALGEIAYAALLTLVPTKSASLLHFFIGLLCTGAVFAVGRRLGGPVAGNIGAVFFYCSMMTAYLSQTAFLDFFTCLFGIVGALLLLIRRRLDWRIAILAGSCAGLGVVVKVHFAYISVGMAITAGLLVLRQGGFRRAISLTTILTLAAILAAAPWFLRSYRLTGEIAGLTFGTSAMTRGADEKPAILSDITTFGFGRTIPEFLALPFTATLASGKFGGRQLQGTVIGGHIGYLLVGMLPLLIVTRVRWRLWAMLAGTLVATGLWFYTAQYLRYALPTLAILCTVGGTAYVGALCRMKAERARAVLNFLLSVLILAGIGVRMLLPDIGHRYALGLQDTDSFLDEHLAPEGAGSYAILRELNSDPSATRVFALHDGARLYSNVRISTPGTTASELAIVGTDDQVLQRLRDGGYSHILLDRQNWAGPSLGWEYMTVVDEGFLRRNTALVVGGRNSYLYRILPPDERRTHTWTQGAELLPNTGFETGTDKQASDWRSIGQPYYDLTGEGAHSGQRAICVAPREQVATEVKVLPDTGYLLTSTMRSAEGYGIALLRVTWRDTYGVAIGVTEERLPTTPRRYHAFSMLAIAPLEAYSAEIAIAGFSSSTWVDDLSFRSVAPGTTVVDFHMLHR